MHIQPLKLLWLWLIPLFLSANFVHWLGDYDTAHTKALKAHKPLLVLVLKQNSPDSNYIIKTVFMNRKYVKTINKKTVAVIVTYEGEASYPAEMYYTTVFPTLFFVDSKQEIIFKQPLCGQEINGETVKKYLNEILD